MKTRFRQCALLLLLCCGMTEAQELANGILEFRIKDEKNGELIPGKLVFLQNGDPAALSVHSEGLLVSHENLVYSANGTGRLTLPAGRYEIWAGHGVEYSISKRSVTIAPNQKRRLKFRLRREVETRGYIAADLRLRTSSGSAPDTSVTERIISCVAEGLEWAVVTDPERAIDFDTILSQLELQSSLKTVAGVEITPGFGHFSVYPVPPNFEGNFNSIADAGQLFQSLRTLSTDPVIQVTHSRSPQDGYFTLMKLDPDFATNDSSLRSWEFDAVEVLNEKDGLGWYAGPDNPIPAHQDWYNLLNSGHRFAAVATSGNHGVLGLSRTYFASSTDAPADVSESELVASIRNRHLLFSRGIFIDLEVHGGFPVGRQVSTRNGLVTFDVSVQAPTWISCDTLKLIANGKVKHTLILKEDRIPERLHGSITVRPTVDTWYVMTATGSRSLAPMYHSLQRPLKPFGFTNPIWVDADGDGKFTPVKERAAALVESNRDDPEALVENAKDDAVLLKFVIGYVGTHDFGNKSELLEKLLSAANLNLRLRIYEFLSQQKDAMAQATLWFRAKTAIVPKERMAIALARYRLGEREQWRIALEHAKRASHKRDVREAFKTFPTRPLRSWQIVGPFEIMQTGIFEDIFAPGRQVDLTATYKAVKWQSHKTPESGHVDLDELYGAYEHAVAYAYTEFNSSTAGEMLFKLSSDDGIVIWLNGEEVYRNYATKRAPYDLIILPVKAGENTFLLRNENRTGNWGFAVEAVDELRWIE